MFLTNLFSYKENAAIKVVNAKNSLNETITEQGIKLNEIDDLKVGADIHAESLEKRVCLVHSIMLSCLFFTV